MKFAARVRGDGKLRALAGLEATLPRAALDAAADALVREAERAPEDAGVTGTIARDGFGAFPPAPWLAPVLPAVRGPMRAAALAAVARALSRSLSSRARRNR